MADVAPRIAATLIEGFDRHYRLFRETTAAAQERFERQDWPAVPRAVKERIRFYDERVRECVVTLQSQFELDALGDEVWQQAKLLYIDLLIDHKRPELAETFFNSVMTRILHRTYAHNDFIFLRAAVATEDIESDPPIYRSYYPGEDGMTETLRLAIEEFGWSVPFRSLERDAGRITSALLEHLGGVWPVQQPDFQLQILSSPFFRNRAAYIVGKIVNGNAGTPLAIAVVHGEQGLEVDAALFDAEEISVLFGLSRAYFMVDLDVPSGTVQFLRTILPAKPRNELYTAVGLGKQGKTLFVRDLLHHLHHSRDAFVEAPGTPGQVMHVFTLPSYPYVFKLIKDRFGSGKNTSREAVMGKFLMAKEVDRVGRMADAVEFTNLSLPLVRFSPELLAQLDELAASSIERDGDELVVRHCYVERRMTPLNVFLETATPEQVERVVRDYGDTIRELAIANIFPGDMLWRNFGVNRHGRVEFYDYDEIEYLTDCVFREVPPAPNEEAELSGEPWYRVGPRDVFPEEFASFLLGDLRVREAFLRHHSDLLAPEFWRDCQARVGAGELVEFFPYPETKRFCVRFA